MRVVKIQRSGFRRCPFSIVTERMQHSAGTQVDDFSEFIDWITSPAPLDRVDLAKVIEQGSEEPSDVYYRL